MHGRAVNKPPAILNPYYQPKRYLCSPHEFVRATKLYINPMKNILIAVIALVALSATQPLHAQDKAWKTLSKITFKKEYNEMMGFKVDVPVFSEDVQNLEGKKIDIRGYIIPVEGYKGHREFIFSAYPYNMCFFCGGAGPETVMEVFAKEPIEYTAEPITIRGTLQLNSDDINRLIYILNDVVKVDAER